MKAIARSAPRSPCASPAARDIRRRDFVRFLDHQFLDARDDVVHVAQRRILRRRVRLNPVDVAHLLLDPAHRAVQPQQPPGVQRVVAQAVDPLVRRRLFLRLRQLRLFV